MFFCSRPFERNSAFPGWVPGTARWALELRGELQTWLLCWRIICFLLLSSFILSLITLTCIFLERQGNSRHFFSGMVKFLPFSCKKKIPPHCSMF